ncbi:hypothetical protein [Mycolicibacterium obuense]|uniref:hypothetical protein n=1 Tax=Mycolicibacterium obuense TaxID=1807 RepID=UPI000699E3E9|nr:hypothetical protein [Mycolicibacterium obuense]
MAISEDVAALLDFETGVEQAVRTATLMARAYTRGRGFEGSMPNEEISAVITTAAARLARNGDQLSRKKVDDVEYEYPLRGVIGWTLAEQIVLNRYRVRAQ